MMRTEKRYGLCYLSACLGAFSNDLLTGCEAADRSAPASFSSAMKRYGLRLRLRLRLRFALFSALNAKCVRCKACGTAVLLIAFCVILRLRPFLRLRRDLLFISSNAVRCRVFIRGLHVGFGFPLLRGSDVNLWRTQGLRIIFDTLIMSILYFYGDIKLIFNKGTVLL